MSEKDHHLLCAAPSVSMYFDVRGNAIACCQNTTNLLGNVNESTLEQIWTGEPAQAMRELFSADEFAPGCDFCVWEAEQGSEQIFARLFDQHLDDQGDAGAWPRVMEFALSNRCNLACVMCNGDFSSTIRQQREGREPMPLVYGDSFFEQLRPFLPHLGLARFFGGEPFLIPEYARIWDLMIEVAPHVESNVTTNGTVLTGRVRDTLEALPFSIGVSVDGMTKETVEKIRVGADYDTVMSNVRWFNEYCHSRKTGFGLTYCLMVANWREFADFLEFADQLDTGVAVNTVVYPPTHSLYRLAAADLEPIVAELESTRDAVANRLGRNEQVWQHELDRLEHWLTELRGHEHGEVAEEAYFEQWGIYQGPSNGPSKGPSKGPSNGPATPVPVSVARSAGSETWTVEEARSKLFDRTGTEPDALVVSHDNIVLDVLGPDRSFAGVPADAIVGRGFDVTVAELSQRHGDVVRAPEENPVANVVERDVVFAHDGHETSLLCTTVVDVATEDGSSTTLAVLRTSGVASA